MRRRGSRDRVSQTTAQRVFSRDGYCAAPRIDPQAGRCFGRSTLEHVKDQPRMGVRAASDERHLVSLCEGHTEPGMKAGRVWNLSHRDELREYLLTLELATPGGEP